MSQEDEPMTKAERVRARLKKGAAPSRTRKRTRAVSLPTTPSPVPARARLKTSPPARDEPVVTPSVSVTATPVTPDVTPPPRAPSQSSPKKAVQKKDSATPHAMASESLEVFETKRDRVVRTAQGDYLDVPEGWQHLPPGDAAVTRRVKAAGACWTVKEKRGRKMFSRGIWADGESIEREIAAREAEIKTPAYQKKLAQSRNRAAKKQEVYVEDFTSSVREFLNFSSQFSQIESQLAEVISAHATPVGSGTVARTERIPIERRAEAAVIAWMRHQTTAYDTMNIPRVKGKRREVRRMLAERSRQLLERYRKTDGDHSAQTCPLQDALDKASLEG